MNLITPADIHRYHFQEYNKKLTTKISDETLPVGTHVLTSEGQYTCTEPSRLAIDANGNVYPITESVFEQSYIVPPPEPVRAKHIISTPDNRHVMIPHEGLPIHDGPQQPQVSIQPCWLPDAQTIQKFAQGGLIPCSERLPERLKDWNHSEWVLVYSPEKDGVHKYRHFAFAYYHYQPPFGEPARWMAPGQRLPENITHWMPLPEQPPA